MTFCAWNFWFCGFPVEMGNRSALLACVHRPEKMQQSILEMAGPKAKFYVCLEECQKNPNPCQNQFFDNYKILTSVEITTVLTI